MASFFFSSGIWRSLKWEYRRSFSSSLLLPPTACVRVVSWCRCCSSRGQRSVLECLCSLRLFTSKCVGLHLTFLKDTNRKNMVHRDNIWLGYILFGYLVKHGVFEMENRNDPGNRKCLYSVTHSIDLSFIWNSQTLSIKISPYRFLELRLTSCLPKNWTLLWPSVSAGCVWMYGGAPVLWFNTRLGLSTGGPHPPDLRSTIPHTLLGHLFTYMQSSKAERAVCLWPIKKATCWNIKEKCWSFLGSGLEGKGVGWGVGRWHGAYPVCILFLFSPIPHFLLVPLFHPPFRGPLRQQVVLILSRFQHAVGLLEKLWDCWWNLAEKILRAGRDSSHNKHEGNERLPTAAREKKTRRGVGSRREMTFDRLWSRWETASRVREGEEQLRGGLALQLVSMCVWGGGAEQISRHSRQVQMRGTTGTVVFTCRH